MDPSWRASAHSWALVDVLGAPDVPSWHVHKSAGGQGRMRRVVVQGSLLSTIQFPIIKQGPGSFSSPAQGVAFLS